MAKKITPEPKVQTRFKQPKQRLFLKEWRKYRDNLTQERLADRAEVSQGMVSQLETGQSDYTGELLEKLAHALRCEPADLIMRNPLLPDAPWTLYEKIQRLKPQDRDVVERMIRNLEEAA